MVFTLNTRGLWLLLISVITFSCNLVKTISSDNPVFFTIDNSSIYTEEFIYNFGKNIKHADSLITQKDIDEYLELYKKQLVTFKSVRTAHILLI